MAVLHAPTVIGSPARSLRDQDELSPARGGCRAASAERRSSRTTWAWDAVFVGTDRREGQSSGGMIFVVEGQRPCGAGCRVPGADHGHAERGGRFHDRFSVFVLAAVQAAPPRLGTRSRAVSRSRALRAQTFARAVCGGARKATRSALD